MKNVFQLFHYSYQVDRIETEKNILPEYAQYRLARSMEYRDHEQSSSEGFWASITDANGTETRYEIKNGEFKASHPIYSPSQYGYNGW